jgi:adenosylcobyric acid synthase
MSQALMIQGTASNAGKSLLVTGLCRIYKRKGISVCPFKAQNMSLNSYVTPDGLEIGRAQALQAAAACLEPSVYMNPVLLKPETDSKSQIVLMGKPWRQLHATEYYEAKKVLWEKVTSSLELLKNQYDLIIAEGAGSPAEINLKKDEIVNMKVARYLQSPVFIASDIDRGGVFASLYGTVELLNREEQELIKGYIINKFRGDRSLLEPGLKMIEDLTGGRKVAGVIPYIRDIGLAQEDSVFLEENRVFGNGPLDIVVVSLPYMSNFDDLDALTLEEGLRIRLVSSPSEIGNPHALIIPGSKTTTADLKWMNKIGISEKIKILAEGGTPVVGICGGYQILGKYIDDREGIEGKKEIIEGLGLLDFTTVMNPEKKTIRTEVHPQTERGFLKEFNGGADGYEIHMGRTVTGEHFHPLFRTSKGDDDGAISENGQTWGTYLHGIFNTPGFRRAWLRSLGWKESGPGRSLKDVQEEQIDHLADIMEKNMDMNFISKAAGL